MAILISHVAIINKKRQIFILRRAASDKVLPGYWDLPGGTVRLKEDPERGAIREVKEECGLTVKDLRILAHTSNWDRAKEEKFVTLIFATKNYQGKIKLNLRDHDGYSWVSKSELSGMKVVSYLKKLNLL